MDQVIPGLRGRLHALMILDTPPRAAYFSGPVIADQFHRGKSVSHVPMDSMETHLCELEGKSTLPRLNRAPLEKAW